MNAQYPEILKLCARTDTCLRDDSRKVKPGDIFIAVPGEKADGSAFIKQAWQNGASHIVCPRGVAAQNPDIPQQVFVEHEDMRRALWEMAASHWHTATHKMKVIGITGTNGKTTSAALLEFLFESMGVRTGVMGTISYRWPGFSIAAPLTTPGALQLQENLAAMARAGTDVAIMEVSSHALSQQRVGGVQFSGALFTNLTQDHLDYHTDMEDYFHAKASLFLDLPKKDKAMAINGDDPYGQRLLRDLPNAMAYGLGLKDFKGEALDGKILASGLEGLTLEMRYGQKSWVLKSPLIGEFNAHNLLGVQALALAMGYPEESFACLGSFGGVNGRMERIGNKAGAHVFVDYAHTPDALINVLRTLRASGFKKIIAVFGCGGNRDRKKRPLMGKAVAEYADIAILTSDNPRREDPEAIMDDVLPGLATAKHIYREGDRRKATALGLSLLGKEDALLIAGKGHEDYQILGDERIHYSDQETVRELLNCN